MKQISQVEETLFSSAHAQLDKRISVKQMLVSSLFALSGIVVVVLMTMLDDSSTTSMLLLAIGVVLLLYSFYRFFTKSHEIIYKPTCSEVRTGTLYMDTTELQRLLKIVKENDFSSISQPVLKGGGNGRLDYLISKDGRFVALQLFHFVPYTYESVTDKLYYTDDAAAAVARCFCIRIN